MYAAGRAMGPAEAAAKGDLFWEARITELPAPDQRIYPCSCLLHSSFYDGLVFCHKQKRVVNNEVLDEVNNVKQVFIVGNEQSRNTTGKDLER